jgi:hypothetical protein
MLKRERDGNNNDNNYSYSYMSSSQKRTKQTTLTSFFGRPDTNKHTNKPISFASYNQSIIPNKSIEYETPPAEWIASKDECQICLGEYETSQAVLLLECWCRFHRGCYQQWRAFNRQRLKQQQLKQHEFFTMTCPLHQQQQPQQEQQQVVSVIQIDE